MAIRTPEARRLRDLQFAVLAAWLAVGFAMVIVAGLMVGGVGATRPAPPGLAEANHVAPWVFLVVAVMWLLSWTPIASMKRRIRTLRWCRVAIYITAGAWLLWVYLRSRL